MLPLGDGWFPQKRIGRRHRSGYGCEREGGVTELMNGAMPSRLTRRGFLRLGGAAGGCWLLTACVPAAGKPPKVEKGVRIGFLTAFTGSQAARADAQFNGLQLAVEEINAKGGIGGSPITVIKEDDQSDGQATVQKVNKLVRSDRVDVIIGLLSSREREAAMSVAPGLGVLVVYTPFSEGGSCSKNLVTTGQLPSQQIEPFVGWLLKNVGRTVFVLGTDDPWVKGSAEAIRMSLEKGNGRVVGTQLVPAGTTEFKPVLQDVRAANPDILWFMLPGSEGIAFARQMADVGLRMLITSSSWDEIQAATAPGLLTGALTSQAWFMTLDTPESKGFVERYQRRFGGGKPVSAIAESTYDAVHLYRAAVEKAGTSDLGQVLRALPDVSFNAPQGPVRIDPATHAMVTQSLIGQVSSRGTIDIHDRLGQVVPSISGCA